MQAHAGHIAKKLEEAKTADKSAVIVLYDTQEAAPVQDFCRNQRFLCRMAKKLGCQICATTKSNNDSGKDMKNFKK